MSCKAKTGLKWNLQTWSWVGRRGGYGRCRQVLPQCMDGPWAYRSGWVSTFHGSHSCFVTLLMSLRCSRQDRVPEEFLLSSILTHPHATHLPTQAMLLYDWCKALGKTKTKANKAEMDLFLIYGIFFFCIPLATHKDAKMKSWPSSPIQKWIVLHLWQLTSIRIKQRRHFNFWGPDTYKGLEICAYYRK